MMIVTCNIAHFQANGSVMYVLRNDVTDINLKIFEKDAGVYEVGKRYVVHDLHVIGSTLAGNKLMNGGTLEKLPEAEDE